MKKVLALGVLGATLLLSGCNGGGGGGGGYSGGGVYTPVNKVDSFVNLLNSRFYTNSFYVVKDEWESLSEGFVVVYSASTGYMAYDIKNYYPGDTWSQYSSRAEYGEVFIHNMETDPYSYETLYFGDVYTNSYNPRYVGEFVFDENIESCKDVAKIRAIKEEFMVAQIGSNLAAEYGLSETRGQEIARLATEWNRMKKSRSMTTADANAFSKELLGVDITKASKAIEKHVSGDSGELKEVIKSAAIANETSPERMGEILSDILQ